MIAISTAWNFGRLGSLEAAVREIPTLGFEAVELRAKGAAPDAAAAGATARDLRVRCRSVHAPLTAGPWSSGDPSAGLASTDEAVRRAAVAAVVGTLPAAAAAGADVIVVHLGRVPLANAADRQRRWLAEVAAGRPAPADEIAAALAERSRVHDRHLDAAARSLFDLTRAEPNVTWSIENREGWHEIPALDEVEMLLEDAAGKRVGFTYDTGHAHLQARLGIANSLAWLDRYGPRTTGLHLHDAAGDVDHLPPGAGEIDWAALAPLVSTGMIRTLEVRPTHSAMELQMGADHVRSLLR